MLQRNYEIKIRFTKDELDELNSKATACNKNREQYCRTVLKDTVPREAPQVDYYNLISELRRVGSNINQILKVAYSQNLVDVPLLRKTLEDYHRTEQMIWKAFSPENS